MSEPRPGLAGLHPGNFALVMAAAILAQDLRVQGWPRLAIASQFDPLLVADA